MNVRVIKRARTRGQAFLFAQVYNEQWFLPHFITHYRTLGIEEFVFYDDRSTDLTREILAAEDDCTIIAPIGERGESSPDALRVQASLSNTLTEGEGRGRWALTVDADEFLLLPERFDDVPTLVEHLEKASERCAFASVVDFFPRRLSERFFDPLGPLEGSPFFDTEPGFTIDPADRSVTQKSTGIRARLLARLEADHPQLFGEIYAKRAYRVAKLWKTPLVKTGHGITRTSPHDISVVPPPNLQLALAHFKFYPDLDRRIEESLARGSHFADAVEYRFLQAVTDLYPNLYLVGPQSVQFRSPADVERAGLMFAQ